MAIACDWGQLWAGSDYQETQEQVSAQTLVMAASTDLYFTQDDCATEALPLPKVQFQLIALLGAPRQYPADAVVILQAVPTLLDTSPA